jgi:hypothetical protein
VTPEDLSAAGAQVQHVGGEVNGTRGRLNGESGAGRASARRLAGLAGRLSGLSEHVDSASDPQWSGRWSGQAADVEATDRFATGDNGSVGTDTVTQTANRLRRRVRHHRPRSRRADRRGRGRRGRAVTARDPLVAEIDYKASRTASTRALSRCG